MGNFIEEVPKADLLLATQGCLPSLRCSERRNGQFNLIVNGTSIATVNAAQPPSGTAAFQVKNTTGTFGNMCVN